jgi:hypothetical protein
MRSLFRTHLVTALAGTLAALTVPAQAAPTPDLRHIQVNYLGGPLLSHARVSTLFWGAGWKQSSLPSYFNGFFRELFADGRYLANLAQYGTPSMPIGNGTFVATASDPASLGAQVTDDQIQAEIRAQVAAHALPAPDANTVYVVFTPPQVVVVDATGADSENDFAGYHDYFFGGQGGGFAYAVIPYDAQMSDPRLMTIAASHELAEAVTDPQPTARTLGWYDFRNGEIGDIPPLLYLAGRIGIADLIDVLVGRDGTRYAVQKIWSIQDAKPVAFAATTSGQ